jgi:hypothetical protein
VSNGEEVEDPSLEFQDAIEEDLLQIVKLAHIQRTNVGGRC